MASINKRFVIPSMAVIAALITVLFMLSSKGTARGKIKIGAPDDSGGLIIHYLVNRGHFDNVRIENELEFFSIGDCCCGSKSEWALSSDRLDMAILCPDAAEELLEKDKRYQIIGSCLLNSDILVVKSGKKPQRIGITQNRNYQKDIVRDKYGKDCRAVPMLTQALPYAYEKGAVDGIVIDVLKGIKLDGKKFSTAGDKDNQVTYVLVARKDFIKERQFKEFLNIFEESTKELNHPENLIPAVREYKDIKMTTKEAKNWNQLKIKFVIPNQ